MEMYGLDTTIDLSFLKGREILQVAIGIHDVQFVFDKDVKISITGLFRCICRAATSEWQPGAPQAAAPALRLLGATVEQVHGQRDGTLELKLSTGDRLMVLDNSKEFESYTITRPGETIVV
jgi:hypothetical protein